MKLEIYHKYTLRNGEKIEIKGVIEIKKKLYYIGEREDYIYPGIWDAYGKYILDDLLDIISEYREPKQKFTCRLNVSVDKSNYIHYTINCYNTENRLLATKIITTEDGEGL